MKDTPHQMAMPIDIAAPLSPPGFNGAAGKQASAGASNAFGGLVSDSQRDGGFDLKGLFAALLDLAGRPSDQANGEAGSAANLPIGIRTALSHSAAFDSKLDLSELIDIKALLAGITKQGGSGGTSQSDETNVADVATTTFASLIDRLKTVLEELKPGEAFDPSQLDQADAAIAAVADVLSVLEDRLDLNPAAKSDIPVAKGDIETGAAAPSLPPAQRSALIDALRDAASVLHQISAAAPTPGPTATAPADVADLGSRLDNLVQRLENLIAADPAKPGGGANPADTIIASLLGKTGDTHAAANPAAALEVHFLRGGNTKPAAPAAQADPLLASGQKSTAGAPHGSARPDQAAQSVPTSAKIAAIAAAQQPATADRSAPSSDPTLLLIQSQTGPQQGAAMTAQPITAAYQSAQPAINVPGVAFEMMRQFNAGNSRFEIRLDPPQMGRIDVKMDVDKSGNVHARLTVERAETLDFLQRDARVLERALQQAGADGTKANLEFSLKQNPFAGQNNGQGDRRGDADPFANDTGASGIGADVTSPPVIQLYRGTASPGGVNLFV